MLDDLLGRTELKERIAELEENRDRLEDQLSAEKRRRSEAATDRQEAERRVNTLEDKVTQLEDQIERLRDDETTLSPRREATLSGGRLDDVLDRLATVETGEEGALTAFVDDGHDLPGAVRQALGNRGALVSRAAPCLVVVDDAGLIAACLRPPLSPAPFAEWGRSFRLERSWFCPQGSYTLALVRSDLFAMGTYEADQRIAFHGFDSALKSQHSKGGFSQSRFERLRDEQIDNHLDRCRAALDEREADRLFIVGEQSVIGNFEEIADETATVDATGDPESALASAWADFWSVQLWVV
ncbi:Vms1/Ankzf1 family peptidyl-tRNA hydrolase [Halovenus salina]|uniref:Vms1/Ankzf1 family peptidyl-tRNA hydrolase n=1 Tax=Halovenus salina TaxID=1510225 RepID=A0ABD5VXI8_9EURY|nr:Vms1/Ankzf1 family peptidyl-tRNA hydrolase [Halovenus salina]